MGNEPCILANADIEDILLTAPERHKHHRTAIKLHSGEVIVPQETSLPGISSQS